MVTFGDSGRNNKYREAKDERADDYNLERHCAARLLKTDLSSALFQKLSQRRKNSGRYVGGLVDR